MAKATFKLKLLLSLFVFGSFAAAAGIAAPTANAAYTRDDCLNRSSSKPSIRISGRQAMATFTIPKNCTNKNVTIASYKAPNGGDGKPYTQQELYRSSTYTYNKPGTYFLKVAIPDCYYQVDLARGGVIREFSHGNTYYQEDRLLDAKHGGNKSCEPRQAAPKPQQPADPVVVNQKVVNNISQQNTVCTELSAHKTGQNGSSATYQFKPRMSGQYSGSPTYSYDFGDGNSIQTAGTMAEHTYVQPGTYNATMTMASDAKQSDTITCQASVEVKEEPPAEQQAAPVASSGKNEPPAQSQALPDTGPGDIAAIGSIWAFMGSMIYAYRSKLDSIVASIVSRLG